MKYIASMRKTPGRGIIRVYIDEQTRDFMVTVKETGFKAAYYIDEEDSSKSNFGEMDIEGLHLLEMYLVHAFFHVNEKALLEIRANIDNLEGDFIGANLVPIDVDLQKEGCFPELIKLCEIECSLNE